MKFSILTLLIASAAISIQAKEASVTSPDGNITATISDANDCITLQVSHKSNPLILPSEIGLCIDGVADASRIKSAKVTKDMSDHVEAVLYRQKEFDITCNALVAKLNNGVELQIRAYNEGIAYRYATMRKGEIVINDEIAAYRMPSDVSCWLPYSTNDEKPMAMAFQNVYDHTILSHAKDKYAFLPATFDYGDGLKLTLTESNLENYPGMYIKADTTDLIIKAEFPEYPAKTDFYPWRKQLYVTATDNSIAHTSGIRTYPWRVMAITTDDTQMPVNNLVYALADPNRIGDTSWIREGKVAWDWWNDWGLKGVPFKAGINMDTYKYYIDFASRNGIEYVVLDEGWYDTTGGDMLSVIPDLNLPELVAYAKERNVGIWLWTVFNVLDSQLEEACSRYAGLGVKGFKVDFLDRDDQTALQMTYRIAEAAARHHLMLDLHGYFKPTGINRTYPNVINFEGVFGMEEVKWTDIKNNMPEYDVTFPYIRLLAGPVDYTPGAMRNATSADWKAIYYHPMSMGTRCHQLATYIVYDSPFTMLCDSPSNYEKEQECVDFIVSIPCNIDETRIISGEIGKYIVTARRSGDEWWIGALTNWEGRDVTIDLGFLEDGEYCVTTFTDGVNANKYAEDYAVTKDSATKESRLTLRLANGGGCAMHLTKK